MGQYFPLYFLHLFSINGQSWIISCKSDLGSPCSRKYSNEVRFSPIEDRHIRFGIYEIRSTVKSGRKPWRWHQVWTSFADFQSSERGESVQSPFEQWLTHLQIINHKWLKVGGKTILRKRFGHRSIRISWRRWRLCKPPGNNLRFSNHEIVISSRDVLSNLFANDSSFEQNLTWGHLIASGGFPFRCKKARFKQ